MSDEAADTRALAAMADRDAAGVRAAISGITKTQSGQELTRGIWVIRKVIPTSPSMSTQGESVVPNSSGASVVTIEATDKAFETSGCSTWVRVS